MKRFDETGIILRIGVASDTHISGSWNQPRSKAKFAHMIKVFQRAAGFDSETGKTRLDALLINGDFVDAVNSIGNVNKNFDAYGGKLSQNVREITHVADCLNGEKNGGVGVGVEDGVSFFYALGNHDEGGRGRTGYNPEKAGFPSMHSAAIFAAIFCGWKCRDFAENSTEFEDYIQSLMRLYSNATSEGKEYFTSRFGIDADKALCLYKKYYGGDISAENDTALLFGNRHTVINGIHFVALEISCCEETQKWFEKICRKSVSENPQKPIFVLTHYRIKDTVFLSEDGTPKLDGILSKYPQVIVFGGHTHTPLFLETAIDESRGFTSVDSSVTAYLSNTCLLSIHGEKDFPQNLPRKESHNFGNGCYIEVDADYNVRINRIDLYRSYSKDYEQEEIYRGIDVFSKYAEQSGSNPCDEAVYIREPWIIGKLGSATEFEYTSKRKNAFSAPHFNERASISIERKADTTQLSFDAAESADMVLRYRVVLKRLSSDEKSEFMLTTSPHMYTRVSDMQKRISTSFSPEEFSYSNGESILISVYAADVWGRESEPLLSSFKV